MTHQNQSNELHAAVQFLVENGFDSMANAMNILFNQAMKIERTHYLNAQPYQRTDERKSQANGFKNKTANSRLGKLVGRMAGLAKPSLGSSRIPNTGTRYEKVRVNGSVRDCCAVRGAEDQGDALEDAIAVLGRGGQITKMFVEFQKYLYAVLAAWQRFGPASTLAGKSNSRRHISYGSNQHRRSNPFQEIYLRRPHGGPINGIHFITLGTPERKPKKSKSLGG